MFQARNSDSQATQDFYAHTDGTFWTSPAGNSSGQQIEAWLSGATAYCSVWYDQSGAGNHATQTDPALQPVVDYANYAMDLTAQGGWSWFYLPSGTVPSSGAYTVTVKHGVINNPTGGWLGGGLGEYNRANNFRRDGSGYVNYWIDNDFSAGSYAVENTVTFKHDGSSVLYLYTNGALAASQGMSSGWNSVEGDEYLGRTIFLSYDKPLNGVLFYLYIFKAALSDAKRSAIEAGAYGMVWVRVRTIQEIACYVE